MHAVLTLILEPPGGRLQIDGELDLAVRDSLRHRLADLRDLVPGPVSLDLAGVTFVDCSSLRLLDDFRRELADARRPLDISTVSSSFRLVCQLAQYDDLVRLAR